MTSAFRALAQQKKPEFTAVDESKCGANGCPCRSSVRLTSSWLCSIHAWVEPEDWPRITEAVHQNIWLLELIRDIRKMHSKGRPKDASVDPWRDYACQFWGEDACKPHPNESFELYVNRMVAEVLYRTGAVKKKPELRLPEPPKKRVRFARQEVAA